MGTDIIPLPVDRLLRSMKFSQRTQNITIVVVLIVLAAVLRIYGIGWGLPGVYEEATPLKKAWEMSGWGFPKKLDLNPHFFNYPSLTIYVQLLGQGFLYLGMKLSGAIDSTLDFRAYYIVQKTPFYIMGRLITVIFSVLTVWVTYLFGRMIDKQRLAMLASFLLAINTFHISKSQVVEVDVPLTFFVVLTFWAIMRVMKSRTIRDYVICGLAVGFATSTKYTGAMLLFPLLAAHFFARSETVPNNHWSNLHSNMRKPSWKYVGIALGVAVLVFIITSPYVLLDSSAFLADFMGERRHMSLGHFGLEKSPTWLFYVQSFANRILGWPSALLAFCGLIYFAAFRRKAWAIIVAAFVLPYWIAIASWTMKADRYLLPTLPLALIFTSGMFSESIKLKKFTRVPNGLRTVIAALVVLILIVPLLAAYPNHLRRLKPDSRTVAKAWIEANIPTGAFILVEPYGPELFCPAYLEPLSPGIKNRVLKRISETPIYTVLELPMFQVMSEQSEAFYDISLYRVADFAITSSAVRSRYIKNPSLFHQQLAFYDSLETRFQKVIEFLPQTKSSPTLTIYKNPAQNVAFCNRRTVGWPSILKPSLRTAAGSKEVFYFQLGLNYESCRYYGQAIACYELAFMEPIYQPLLYKKLVMGMTRCLVSIGEKGKAVEFLERAAASAPEREMGNYFRSLRQQILLGKQNKNE